jgi:rhamnose utilization protein RhaD (predicted bifunctional aldolase and dehydrogenase)
MMPPEPLRALAALSAALGRDPEQVQAAGGNTSLKLDGILWVKASGLWLADASQRNLFVPLRLEPLVRGIHDSLPDPVSDAVARDLDTEGLRPSIETTLHALLPHRVVIHTHSVRTIALAVRADAERHLQALLAGLAWTFIPYAQPGTPLTRLVAARLEAQPFDVLVLGNHGLVVGADSVEAARALLAEVERRLDLPIRPRARPEPNRLAAEAAAFDLRPVRHAEVQALAADPIGTDFATSGTLYPDHVIFLGRAARRLRPPLRAEAVHAALASGSKLMIVPGLGVFLPDAAPQSADELALCLALVLARVPEGAPLVHLGAEAEDALLNWDAEKYRQKLAR